MSNEQAGGQDEVVTHPVVYFTERYGDGVIGVISNAQAGEDETVPEDQFAVAVVTHTEHGLEPYPIRGLLQDDDSWAEGYWSLDAAQALRDALDAAISRATAYAEAHGE